MSEKNVVKIDKDLEEIIPMFVDNRHKDIQEIRTHLENNDLTAIEVIAHKLAGNAGSYGFMDLSKIGADMEASCKTNDLDSIKAQFENYKNFMDNLVVEFE